MTERERYWWKLFSNIEFGLDLLLKLALVELVFHATYALAILGSFLRQVLR